MPLFRRRLDVHRRRFKVENHGPQWAATAATGSSTAGWRSMDTDLKNKIHGLPHANAAAAVQVPSVCPQTQVKNLKTLVCGERPQRQLAHSGWLEVHGH